MHSKTLLLVFVFAALSVAHPLVSEKVPQKSTPTGIVNGTKPEALESPPPEAPSPSLASAKRSQIILSNNEKRSEPLPKPTPPVNPLDMAAHENSTVPHVPRREQSPPSPPLDEFIRRFDPIQPSNSTEGTPEEIPQGGVPDEEVPESRAKGLDEEKGEHQFIPVMIPKRNVPVHPPVAAPATPPGSHSKDQVQTPVKPPVQPPVQPHIKHVPREEDDEGEDESEDESIPEEVQRFAHHVPHHQGRRGIRPVVRRNARTTTRKNEMEPQAPIRPPVVSHGAGTPLVGVGRHVGIPRA